MSRVASRLRALRKQINAAVEDVLRTGSPRVLRFDGVAEFEILEALPSNLDEKVHWRSGTGWLDLARREA